MVYKVCSAFWSFWIIILVRCYCALPIEAYISFRIIISWKFIEIHRSCCASIKNFITKFSYKLERTKEIYCANSIISRIWPPLQTHALHQQWSHQLQTANKSIKMHRSLIENRIVRSGHVARTIAHLRCAWIFIGRISLISPLHTYERARFKNAAKALQPWVTNAVLRYGTHV